MSDTGDRLADGVLHLDAGVDFDEVERAGVRVHQELGGAGTEVRGGAGEAYRRGAQRLACRLVEVGRGRPLHHLLVAPLHRAVALEEMDHVAVGVAYQLHLDMAGAAHQLLQEDLVAAEGGLRLAAPGRDLRREVAGALDHPHAAATAAPARLGHDGKADAPCRAVHRRFVVREGSGRRHHREAGPGGEAARLQLAAQHAHHLRLRPDEEESGVPARLGEVGVLRQEAVARVHRVGPHLARDAHDVGDVEVGVYRLPAPADQVGLVRLESVQGITVFVREQRDRLYPELVRRAQHPDRDLAAVGDQQLADAPVAAHVRPLLVPR